MDKLDRIFDLHKILSARRNPFPFSTLKENLECAESTVRRLIGKLRDELGALLVHDRRARGWHYDCPQGEHPFELRGF
jgi:proteasome accessory factor C